MFSGLYILITLAVVIGAVYLIFRLNPDAPADEEDAHPKPLRGRRGHRARVRPAR